MSLEGLGHVGGALTPVWICLYGFLGPWFLTLFFRTPRQVGYRYVVLIIDL